MEYISSLTWNQETKIMIGIDIGTTQTAVAIGLLERGVDVRKALHSVTEWPGQDLRQSKIPTAIWYDGEGNAMSFGADTESYDTEEKADDEKWSLAKHFKLHLHPAELKAQGNITAADSLPLCVSLERVYSDFLEYLFKHTEEYFKDRILRGDALWSQCRDDMEFVIAHPNAWSTREQAFLRKAAIKAKLVNKDNASTNIRFVTEAEASVHYCLYDSNLVNHLKPGANFAVVDAGGSTVDTTLYSVASNEPLFKIEERNIPGCVQAGAIFIDREAKNYMKNTLKGANLPDNDIELYCKDGIRDFEVHAKRTFSNEDREYFINVGNTKFTAPSASIRRGRMGVASTVMKSFYDVCINQILKNVDEQIKGVTVSDILLVGGFGDSPYLRKVFKKHYEGRGCQVTLIDSSRPTSKAVADGTVIWSYSQAVVSRRPRSTFGTTCAIPLDLGDPEHRGRPSYVGLDGLERISGKWDTIAVKGVPLQVTSVNRRSFCRQYSTSSPHLGNFQESIEAYDGNNPPYWSKNRIGFFNPGFRKECKVTADLQNLSGALEERFGLGGNSYWELEFSLCIRFGGVELEAFVEWEEGGKKKEGPVTILPDQPIGA